VGVLRQTPIVEGMIEFPPPAVLPHGDLPRKRERLKKLASPYSDALALAPPLETATSAGRSTRSPIV
jgi:hypothetical protein